MWGVTTKDFSPLIEAAVFLQVALSCLAVALTRRWWSALVALSLPFLFGLVATGGEAIEFIPVILILGGPPALLISGVAYLLSPPPDRLLGWGSRVGAFVVAVVAIAAIARVSDV